ncbi:MAG TPA: AAA family ATPase [Thermomicrobiales bacterium]|nr:AAA family ATPase [Thermomicrobiales bacterium]
MLAFANQKGGVGKTTSAVNTAAILSRRGFRTLLIDIDPQGNSTSSLGVDKTSLTGSTYDVLVDEIGIAESVVSSVRENLDLLATTPTLAAAEVELVNAGNREHRLQVAVRALGSAYDAILIDCPPSLGMLTVNALTASDSVIVPIQCEFLALEGVSQLITTIDLVKRQLNPDLDILGILMTMYDSRTRLSAHVVAEVRRYFPDRIFTTVIPRSVRLAEAPSYGQSILEYDATSRGGDAYEAFVSELSTRAALVPHRSEEVRLATTTAT